MNFGLTLGNRYFNDRFGVMLAASYNNAPAKLLHNTEFIREKDDNGKTYINDYQIRQYFVTRERRAIRCRSIGSLTT